MNTYSLQAEKASASSNTVRPAVLVREISSHHRENLRKHFLDLAPEDRLLRFGQMVGDDIINNYVNHIDFNHDTVFGVFDSDLQLIGVGHLAYPSEATEKRTAEFGVSVSSRARGLGVGSALFQRAAIHSRNTQIQTLYMHCLSRNNAMMHIARKAGMDVHYEYGEADAYLTLRPADSSSVMIEHLHSQVADFDYAVKRNFRNAQNFWKNWQSTKKVA